jgi:hypothetical protein
MLLYFLKLLFYGFEFVKLHSAAAPHALQATAEHLQQWCLG